MITYNGQVNHRTVETGTHEIRSFLEWLIAQGALTLDPNGTVEIADLYGRYTQAAPDPMTRNMFGRCLTALGSPTIYRDRRPALRGGLRFVPAS